MKIGYARAVPGQKNFDLSSQVSQLTAAGCERIVECGLSAGSHAQAAAIEKVLEDLDAGDTLVVTELSRLGKPIGAVLEMIDDSIDSSDTGPAAKRIRCGFRGRGIGFVSLAEGIDTTQPGLAGEFLPEFAAAAYKMSRQLILERTKISQQVAKNKDRNIGRPHAIPEEKLAAAKAMIASGMPVRETAKILGVGSATLYRRIDVMKAAAPSQTAKN